MDESRRMCMGMSTTHHLPRRKYMENSSFSMNHVNMVVPDHNVDVDDFSDVFGGPPRSVLCWKLSGDSTRSTSFYEEVFRPPEFFSSRSMKDGRSLPVFKIPAREEGFYSDIFGSVDDNWRSRERSRSNSKAKSNSSSVLSSEELSPLRPVVRDDVGLSSFASQLRPINVPCRWNSTTMVADEEAAKRQQGMPVFPSTRSFYNENLYVENEYENMMRSSSYNYGFSRRVTSPETISLEPHSFRSVKISADDFRLNSPPSPASSLCYEPVRFPGDSMKRDGEEDYDDDDDEVMSSYVIEINSDLRESNGEAVSIDEAIAWAKEKYNSQSSEKTHSPETQGRWNSHESFDLQMNGHGTLQSPKQEDEEKKFKAKEERERSEEHIKMGVLDDDVKLWSSGKENNMQLLLSTLHQILRQSSGWNMIPLTSLKESSQVKKAYQKARLCLHPDKLQQRGATLSQKYVAEKAFTILQDAWAGFISQDVLFN
ncbi:Chaperone DnaJ-domain-containing protein, putative isoform 2 [Hibiscus syriacus]|uniref:Chaperone DnaJ-domain-containing protein, putative isoform 2 n=1 Tax=Hibiscus syriacus TaxID=106335 RepID=A0A6A2WPW7_HIBSY|nr:Chaperone DnaJ-domain-containing protein, putative isoform 2 [Hibiscus syriacus]